MNKSITTKMHDKKNVIDLSAKKRIDEVSNDLLDYIAKFLPNVCITQVKKAIDFAVEAHKDQKRASSDPYVTHPIAVAKILAEVNLDTCTIVCGLLHDVVEDTTYTLDDISREFGEQEANIVAGLIKLNKIESKHVKQDRAENLRRLLIAVAEDARVLLIKLADRLHNMLTLSSIPEHRKRMRIAKETIDIYAPLADRIGIHYFKNNLYDLAFDVLYPYVRLSIIEQVRILKDNGHNDIQKIVDEIISVMQKNNLDVVVKGREKTPFSIWQKMEKKKIYFEDLSDILAVRIITQNPIDCYLALGIIHINYKVISKEFFDYVSTPKQNGYSSIHTVIMVHDTVKVEIQIRTSEMNHIAELGIAAHWIYKSNNSDNNDYQNIWLKKIRSIIDNINSVDDVLSHTKLSMYADQVFCFTPKGDVIALPKNSTPLDFAFEVNVNLGHFYEKALVNGKYVSITTKLQNGDQVEILTSDHLTITYHWFDIVCTIKAKNEIQVYLEKKLFESTVISGSLSIQDECDKQNLYINYDKLNKIADYYNTNINDLLFNVGKGTFEVSQIIETLSQDSLLSKIKIWIKHNFTFSRAKNQNITKLATLKHYAAIQFPYCCNVNPQSMAVAIYDPICKSVTLHSDNCNNINKINKKQNIYKLPLPETIYELLNLQMNLTINQYSAAIDVFDIFTTFGISQYTINIKQLDENLIIINISLKLVISHQLDAIINKIKQIPNVIDLSIL